MSDLNSLLPVVAMSGVAVCGAGAFVLPRCGDNINGKAVNNRHQHCIAYIATELYRPGSGRFE